jgi:hypothetical protein
VRKIEWKSRHACAQIDVRVLDGARRNTNNDLTTARLGIGHILVAKNLRSTMPVKSDGLHRAER